MKSSKDPYFCNISDKNITRLLSIRVINLKARSKVTEGVTEDTTDISTDKLQHKAYNTISVLYQLMLLLYSSE